MSQFRLSEAFTDWRSPEPLLAHHYQVRDAHFIAWGHDIAVWIIKYCTEGLRSDLSFLELCLIVLVLGSQWLVVPSVFPMISKIKHITVIASPLVGKVLQSACLSVWLCMSTCIYQRPNFMNVCLHVTCGRGSILLWRQCGKFCISVFLDDFVFV